MSKSKQSDQEFWSDKDYQTHLEVEGGSTDQPSLLDLKRETDSSGKLVYTLTASEEMENLYLNDTENDWTSSNSVLVSSKIATFDPSDNSLEVFPTNVWGDNVFTLPCKYEHIKMIRFEELPYQYRESTAKLSGMLKKVPRCFITEVYRGLGFKREYASILHAIEQLSEGDTIVVSNREEVSTNGNFIVPYQKLEELSREVDRIYSRANSAKREITEVTSHNVVAEILGKPSRKVSLGRHPMRKLITYAASNESFVDDDQKSKLVSAVEANISGIAKSLPEQTFQLKTSIEDITLARLIEQFEELIGQKHSEKEWQEFFKLNPIIINVATSHPIIFIQDEASVGGAGLVEKVRKLQIFFTKICPLRTHCSSS